MTTESNPTCASGKIGFANEKAALRSARTMARTSGKDAPGFAYECSTCKRWHLTNQSSYARRARRRAAWRAVGHRATDTNGEGRTR